MAKFTQLIDIDKVTINRTELSMARVRIGYKSVDSIPKKLMIVVGNPRRKISVRVVNRILLPPGTRNINRAIFEMPEPMAADDSWIEQGKASLMVEVATPSIGNISAAEPQRRFT